jgi:hypothetical protein
MSLSSYNGENSFTIKGKKFIKRGANNIYDIASVAGTSGNFSTGWVNSGVANGATLTFNHNLGTTDLVYNVYAAKDNSGTDAIDISNHEISQTDVPRADYGSQALITSNTIQVVLGSQGLLIPNIGATYNVSNSNFTTYPYIKVVASAGGGGNQILAQGRVYDMDSGYASFAFDQIGFSGSPQFVSSGATGFNDSAYYFYWNFPGININDHIIKVSRTKHKLKSSGGNSAIDTYLEWRISGSNIIVVWDLKSPSSHHPDMMDHYISVESSPF